MWVGLSLRRFQKSPLPRREKVRVIYITDRTSPPSTSIVVPVM